MLSLILPTFNEALNIPLLVPKILDVLKGQKAEIIIVDDNSPDRTWDVARKLTGAYPELRIIRRIGRRGLSSAVIEGFLAANGDTLMVMDADGQHDLHLLPVLAEAITGNSAPGNGRSQDGNKREKYDIAIGSRYVSGGSVGEWDERRFALSRMATRLAQKLCTVQVADPMSGFFALSRKTFEAALPNLNPKGFKILLDLLVHAPAGTTATEIPFTFSKRLHGESKLSRRVQLEFLEYLYDVTMGRYIPMTLLKYMAVGLIGVAVHLLTYLAAETFLPATSLDVLGFSLPLVLGIEAAIIFNFWLNNAWTFKEARLRGFAAFGGF
jgi:dolichol-phosphate mannosyltransferase